MTQRRGKGNDRYGVVRRIIWIRDQLAMGQIFNATDVAFQFDISLRTAHRDMRFVRDEYFQDRMKFSQEDNSFYLDPEK